MSNSMYVEIDKCRLCNAKELRNVLDLGSQPPANSLRANLHDSLIEAPLKLVHCSECACVQLTATVDPDYLFSRYVWVTATSATARIYSEVFCAEVLKRLPDQSPFVVEVASNDGTFLRQFKNRGCQVLGIDPAQNIATAAGEASIPTWGEFFNIDIAKRIVSEFARPKLVIARNVIPHVKEIHSIVEGLSELVGDDGVVVIEFHYAKTIVEELHYDSIYHEHLFYFSIEALCALFAQYGLKPFDAFESPISGGSLVIFFSHKKLVPSEAISNLREAESKSKLNRLCTWQEFGVRSINHAESLKKTVLKYAEKQKLIAYGASARSSTLMNFAGISKNDIDCVIDRNPIKQGLYTPGTDIPIVPFPECLKQLQGKHLLLLAWNFADEIVNDLRAGGFSGDIIVPLPGEVHIR